MSSPESSGPDAWGWLGVGGEMARAIRSFDWSRTPLGPIEGWPQSLRTAVSICLGSRFPMMLWWGRELVNLYNDAWGDTPAVAVTAYARAEDRAQAERAGFQRHVAKPVEPAELITTVARLAGRG